MTAKNYSRGENLVPEVVLSEGPTAMGVTGDGSFQALTGGKWMGLLDANRKRFVLYRRNGSAWEEITTPDIAHLTDDVRHLAMCFDQSARHVLAYQHTTDGLYVRQWDAVLQQWVYRGPFAGCDPVLLFDAETNYRVEDSDVLLLYLSPDRLSLRMRVQRELFATEHVLETYTTAKTLDQGVQLPYQWELLGDGLVVRSDMYPVYLPTDAFSTLTTGLAKNTGLYRPIVVIADVGTDVFTAATASLGTVGNYHPVVIIQNLPTDAFTSASAGLGTVGNYHLVVITTDVGTDVFTAATASLGTTGNYHLVVAVYDRSSVVDDFSAATVALASNGGSYV